MSQLLRKSRRWEWSDEQQEAFDQLKVHTPDRRERLWTRRRSHPRDGGRRTRQRVREPAYDQGRGELFRRRRNV